MQWQIQGFKDQLTELVHERLELKDTELPRWAPGFITWLEALKDDVLLELQAM